MRLALALAASLTASACGASIGDPAVGGGGAGGGGGELVDAATGGSTNNDPGTDAATGGNLSDAGALPSVATAEDLLHGVFGSICTEAFSCKSSYAPASGDTFAQDWGTSVANCTDGFDAYYGAGHINGDVTNGKATFDASAASACLAGIAFSTCADFFNDVYTYPAACSTAIVGSVATGGACNSAYECADASADCPPSTLVCTVAQ